MGIMSYAVRGAKLLPEFLLGTGAEAVGRGIRSAGKGASIWTRVKSGGLALEADIANKALKGGFFKRNFKELISTPKAILTGGKVGARAAKIAGKSAALGAAKGGLKTIAKRMPMIGAVLTLAIEAPNIFKAFKDGGFKEGMKEVGGAGVELGCMAGGAAIGSAICPGVGTVVGGLIGGIVGMFTRGKTYSEKKAEEEAQPQAQNAVQYTNEEIQALRQAGLTDEEIAIAQQNGYTVQDIAELLQLQQQQEAELNAQTQNNGYPQQYNYYPNTAYNPLINPYYQYQNGTYNNPYFDDYMYQQTFGYPTQNNQYVLRPNYGYAN